MIQDLNPKSVWQHFDSIRQIPRPSKHEERIVEFLLDWAKGHGFATKKDAVGNMVIRVPASKGHESAPVVVLQAHLDMVCEKNSDVQFDFMMDAIKVRIVDDYVYATGTTLGADNGIGVAAAMAVALDRDVVHGPLELLFTVDEETGLTGAQGLDVGMISGRVLLNLDTEEDGAVYIGCAGGADTHIRFSLTRQAATAGFVPLHLQVRGLRGGHSGCDIHENRGNAIKLVARMLYAARQAGIPFEISSLSGGSKRNAIPREADALLFVPADQETVLGKIIDEKTAAFAEEFAEVEPGLKIALAAATESGDKVWSKADANRVLDALIACPNGVLAMSRVVPGLVETSTNLGVVVTEGDQVRVTCLTRSSFTPALKTTGEQIATIFRFAGADVEVQVGYPGWKPNAASPILKTVRKVYEREIGHQPEVKAIHAGLECGLIGGRIPDMDMTSIGPQIESPHSPDERVKISSVANFYRLLTATLAELA